MFHSQLFSLLIHDKKLFQIANSPPNLATNHENSPFLKSRFCFQQQLAQETSEAISTINQRRSTTKRLFYVSSGNLSQFFTVFSFIVSFLSVFNIIAFFLQN
jgi:hypothetical protein